MSDQLTCPLCNKQVPFTLVPHIRDDHSVDPLALRSQFPNQALHSAGFAEFVKSRSVSKRDGTLSFQLDVAGAPMTARYGVDHPLIPATDTTFVWTDPHRDLWGYRRVPGG
ncbi:MAG: hypothetical protein H6819_02330 [Phycisphaerales bacterium]|nr:hypothetical protein [Phycisphaerales bacterium]MCB9856950.1 hypothetical protein [Phycisphaerales bacterium]MCB9861923.1 hypothetical protein [Phycisphaerales bacterium]